MQLVKMQALKNKLKVSVKNRCFDTVSYTHLDVYKRQVFMYVFL